MVPRSPSLTVQPSRPVVTEAALPYGFGSAFLAEALFCCVTVLVHLTLHYKARSDGGSQFGLGVGAVTLATVQCLVRSWAVCVWGGGIARACMRLNASACACCYAPVHILDRVWVCVYVFDRLYGCVCCGVLVNPLHTRRARGAGWGLQRTVCGGMANFAVTFGLLFAGTAADLSAGQLWMYAIADCTAAVLGAVTFLAVLRYGLAGIARADMRGRLVRGGRSRSSVCHRRHAHSRLRSCAVGSAVRGSAGVLGAGAQHQLHRVTGAARGACAHPLTRVTRGCCSVPRVSGAG
jgi:hypothetical protein